MNKASSRLEEEFRFYLEKQDELTKKYGGKFIVIRNSEIIGVFDSEIEAVQKTSIKYELGSFLVQKCELGDASYTQTYHSRVIFSPM